MATALSRSRTVSDISPPAATATRCRRVSYPIYSTAMPYSPAGSEKSARPSPRVAAAYMRPSAAVNDTVA